MARIAEQYCHRMILADVEELDLSELGQYDAILLGDVLEQLRRPAQFLTKVVDMLKPGGKILLSLPNTASIRIRLNLLLGRFNYRRVGILDETGLQFLTLKGSMRIANDSGLDVISTLATPIPLPLIVPPASKGKPFSFLHCLRWGITRLRTTWFGYQFILVCQAKASSDDLRAA